MQNSGDNRLVRQPIEQVAAKSLANKPLTNNIDDFEWKTVMTYLAYPFLVVKDGIVYFGFDDYEYYVWQGDNIIRKYP